MILIHVADLLPFRIRLVIVVVVQISREKIINREEAAQRSLSRKPQQIGN
jgi:hypothetical protein